MSKWIFGLVLLPFLLLACQAKQKGMETSRKNALVDSLVGVKMEEVNRQAMEDLDRRMSIEVKAKADSIILSKQDTLLKNTAPADNTLDNKLPVP